MNQKLAEIIMQWQRQPIHVAFYGPVVVASDDPAPFRIDAVHDPEFVERERRIRAQQGD